MEVQKMRTLFALLIGVITLAACDSSTGPGSQDLVEVRFQAVSAGAMAAPVSGPSRSANAWKQVSVPGSNGTLEIDGVWMIVAEFELESDGDGEDDMCPGMEDDDCHEFEAPPFFAELPLDQGYVSVATDEVPPGVYEEFEFEVEDLDDDDEDDGMGASQLLSDIRASFPNWPTEASLRIVGTFTPNGGDAQPFEVYVDAEIEVERELDQPLVVEEDTPGAEAIVVEVDPRAWFQRGDGTVWDLSQFDWEQTGILLDFEVELDDGFMQIEVEDID
jgi:hypothetical protein